MVGSIFQDQEFIVCQCDFSCFKMSFAIMRHEGRFYRGFGTSLMGTIPARALYMTALKLPRVMLGQSHGLRILLHTRSFGVVLVVVWGRRRNRIMVQSMVVVVVLGLSRATLVVQGLSAAMASGVSALNIK
ncbi:hypothetical protein F8388_024201 [Cannabis sativa]|uniref:Uncharacterized protein n=1 Tax=Cannabis sativa TaxID=3483 RepID=A0A7J6E009_CANSA|nr:hypothetical protein F8388_024201 [Cannabis sativa]